MIKINNSIQKISFKLIFYFDLISLFFKIISLLTNLNVLIPIDMNLIDILD